MTMMGFRKGSAISVRPGMVRLMTRAQSNFTFSSIKEKGVKRKRLSQEKKARLEDTLELVKSSKSGE